MTTIQTQADLEKLISNQIEENLHLDYKASDALSKADKKKVEISKDVSALANSDGGQIIYGIQEFSDPTKKHLPERINPVSRGMISKEWVEQVINSNISPRISGIKITPIPINSSTDEVVYVIEVPKSETAHQAGDFRYYKRYNFESVPMYDYEVRDIMNRSKQPIIELEFELDSFITADSDSPPGLYPRSRGQMKINSLKVYGRNKGRVYSNYVNCYIEVPSSLISKESYSHLDEQERDGLNYKSVYCDNTIREIREANPGLMGQVFHKYWPSRYEPILPGTRMRFETISLIKNELPTDGIIHWTIYADNAEEKTGHINIRDIKIADS